MIHKSRLKSWLRAYGSLHFPDGRPPVFLCGIPRGGSTWIMEVLSTRPGTRMIAEPFNLRVSGIAKYLGTTHWSEIGTPTFSVRACVYLQRLEEGRIRFLNPNPLVQRRFVTRRTLYKVIHLPVAYALELAIGLGGLPLVLLRHPASVALSRKVFPWLESSEGSPFLAELSDEQMEILSRVRALGDHWEQGILAWCLHYQNYLSGIQLNDCPASLLTYEEMLTDAAENLSRVEQVLGEAFPQKVYERLKRPSRVQSKSDAETRKILSEAEGTERTRHLLSRWMDQVDEETCARGQKILDVFNIRIYNFQSPLPQLTRTTVLL